MKKFLALILCLSVMTVATACGSKEEAPETTPETQTESTETADATTGETEELESQEVESQEDDAEELDQQAEATFTGILEEKKDFMVVVGTEDQSASYMFTLDENVTCDAQVGDRITVTYTGDMEVPEADQNLTATAIALAE